MGDQRGSRPRLVTPRLLWRVCCISDFRWIVAPPETLWPYHFLWDRPTIQGEHLATFQSPTLFARRSFGHLLPSYRSADGDLVFRVYEGFKIDSWERYGLLPAPEG